MTRRVVNVGSEAVLFSSDGQPPLADRTWALVRARVVDELTGEPPVTRMTVETDRTDVTTRAATGGLVGLVGIPSRAFPALNAQDYRVGLTVGAEGYVARRESVKVAKDTSFPAVFAATNVGDLALHREPTVISGRTVLASGGTTAPVAGATVQLTGVWRTLPPANVVVPAESPLLVSLEPPTYFARDAAPARLRRRNMTPVAGQDKQLLDAAPKGSATLRLSDRVGLAANDIIAVGEGDPERTEYLVVASVKGATTADQPAAAALVYPTAREHAAGALARKVAPQAPGANRAFGRECIAGDAVVFLNSLAGLNTAVVVEITGGTDPVTAAPLPAEFHLVRRFTATSDADGYFRLPPLSRVAQAEIQADDGGAHADIKVTLVPLYAGGEHHIDFVFR
jgi:hypothetical protein